MVDRPERKSALAALRAGATIEVDSGAGANKVEAQKPEKQAMEGGGNTTGRSAGTAPAATGAPSPVAALGARTAKDYESMTQRPQVGRHPKTGEPVDIDWSQAGASEEAPFGVLPDGSPRVRRASKKSGGRSSAGGQSAIRSDASVSILADAIFFVHTFAAGITQHSHWNMSQDEARNYADAITELQAAYGVDLSPKQAAWAKAATVIGIPTSLRIVASMTYKPQKKVDPPKNPVNAQQAEQKQQPKAAPQTPAQPKAKGPQTPSELFAISGGDFLDGLTPGE